VAIACLQLQSLRADMGAGHGAVEADRLHIDMASQPSALDLKCAAQASQMQLTTIEALPRLGHVELGLLATCLEPGVGHEQRLIAENLMQRLLHLPTARQHPEPRDDAGREGVIDLVGGGELDDL